jgi:hypothetical protein
MILQNAWGTMRAFAPIFILTTIPLALAAQPSLSRQEQRDSTVMRTIEARMRVASGTLIRATDSRAENASLPTDLLRFARGFRWRSTTLVQTRGTASSFQARQAARCESLPVADSIPRRGSKFVAVYLNGTRLPGGLEMINRMVPIADVLAVEAYPDVLSAPSYWRTNDACAVIAYWTKWP